MIYFDHNATSPLCPAARDAWLSTVNRFWGNPSSPHRMGARAESVLESTRQTAAELLGCNPFDLIWTSGATEANNTLFFHAAQTCSGEKEVWLSAQEHPSVLAAAARWFRSNVRLLRVNSNGIVDLEFLAKQLRSSRPALVCIMAANNETGVLQPWSEAMALCHRSGVPFGCDAAQWIGKEPAAGLGACDFVVGSAHKFGGPLGVGFIKASESFRPLLLGGPQEHHRRAGTENLPGLSAMVAAWSERERQISGPEMAVRKKWRDEFIEQVCAALPEVEIVGGRSSRLWNTVAAIMPAPKDCRRRWVVQLDRLGFAVSTGSACASGKETPSHVLAALGYSADKGDRMLRFSSGWTTTEADWRDLFAGIKAASAVLSGPTTFNRTKSLPRSRNEGIKRTIS